MKTASICIASILLGLLAVFVKSTGDLRVGNPVALKDRIATDGNKVDEHASDNYAGEEDETSVLDADEGDAERHLGRRGRRRRRSRNRSRGRNKRNGSAKKCRCKRWKSSWQRPCKCHDDDWHALSWIGDDDDDDWWHASWNKDDDDDWWHASWSKDDDDDWWHASWSKDDDDDWHNSWNWCGKSSKSCGKSSKKWNPSWSKSSKKWNPFW